MAKKHSILKTVAVTTGALYAANRFISFSAKNKNMCSSDRGHFYSSKHGEIYYTKQGQGSPVLLLHNLDTTSSTYEWSKITKKLEKEYTVYCLDLLGCGQSDKPCLTYSNYLFVQIISDFIKDIIREKTSIITSGDAASIGIMAKHMDDTMINKIIMINPPNLKNNKMETNTYDMILKKVLYLPLIGTFLYNLYVREEHIKLVFRNEFFSNKNADYSKYVDTYYQSAHIHNSNGRYLYASKLCNYTNIDTTIGLKGKDDIYIIESTERKNYLFIAEGYTSVNDKITITYLSNSKLLPQLEVPEHCAKIILSNLS